MSVCWLVSPTTASQPPLLSQLGQFRDGLKDGRGEEYNKEGRLVYKGDFSEGHRHGFGAVFLSEGHRYMGRLEKGVMTGECESGVYVCLTVILANGLLDCTYLLTD